MSFIDLVCNSVENAMEHTRNDIINEKRITEIENCYGVLHSLIGETEKELLDELLYNCDRYIFQLAKNSFIEGFQERGRIENNFNNKEEMQC